MKGLLISGLCGMLFLAGYFSVLAIAAQYSPAMDKDRAIHKECRDKGGVMIYRSYQCVRSDALITLEALK